MNEITKSGKTVDEAVELAIKELQVSRDQIDIEVLEEPKKGFFGFIGTKEALIRVVVKPEPIDPVQKAKEYLESVIQNMNIDVFVEVKSSNERWIEFELVGENLALLIGKRGQTLNAIQYLTSLVANRYSEHKMRVMLDAEGYRSRRKESLEKLAQRLADKAIKTKHAVRLEPMPSYERKVIHTILQQNNRITTSSHGEEPYRYIVITPQT